MTKQEAVNYINNNSSDIEKNLNPDLLGELLANIDSLQSMLIIDLGNQTDEINKIREQITKIDAEKAEKTELIESLSNKNSIDRSDFNFCKDLVPKVKKQLSKAELHIKTQKLLKKTPTYDEALLDRLDKYDKERNKAFLFESENKTDLEDLFNKIQDVINPKRKGYIPVDQNWVNSKVKYNEIVLDLCEKQAKGQSVTLTESSKRFEVIDVVIAQYEDWLFA